MSQKPPFNSHSGDSSSKTFSASTSVSASASSAAPAASLGFTGAEVATSSAFQTRAYHELLDNPHIELDGLQRLEENLARLEDLHGRLAFLMRDLTVLLRR